MTHLITGTMCAIASIASSYAHESIASAILFAAMAIIFTFGQRR